jgi:hypothetical protein
LGEIEELEIATAKHHPSRFAVAFEVSAEPGRSQAIDATAMTV